MAEINLMDRYPRSKRALRGTRISDVHREIACKFGQEYFDGTRDTGYGGYYYHPRFWPDTVKRFRDHYGLKPDASVLDVGCAKGFMLYDFKQLMPDLKIAGIDISQYAIDHSREEVREYLSVASADALPFPDKSFDLVTAINTIHNLPLDRCSQALREIQRVSRKHAFIVVDAWKTEVERRNLMDWVLTAKTCLHVDDWVDLFAKCGYTGDYYWFILDTESIDLPAN